jgi:hypothetical protein
VIVRATNTIIPAGDTVAATTDTNQWHTEGMSHERIVAVGIYCYHTSPTMSMTTTVPTTKCTSDGAGVMFRRRVRPINATRNYAHIDQCTRIHTYIHTYICTATTQSICPMNDVYLCVVCHR